MRVEFLGRPIRPMKYPDCEARLGEWQFAVADTMVLPIEMAVRFEHGLHAIWW